MISSSRPTKRHRGSLNIAVTCCLLLRDVTASVAAAGLSTVQIARPYDGAPQLEARTGAAAGGGGNSSASAPSSIDRATQARYGHAALYYPSSQSILFLGGQTKSEAERPSILGSALLLDLSQPFTSSSRLISIDQASLPPTAWASDAIDSDGRGWLLGGLAPDCSASSPPTAFLLPALSDGSYSVSQPALHPRPPPRRRQAASISLGADIWLFGGIADRFTCSPTTAAYRGIDKLDTVSGSVESWSWADPEGAETGWEPPVGDSRAGAFDADIGEENHDHAQGSKAVLVGGQTASGKLKSLREMLVFNPADRSWVIEIATGEIPSPRMGHVLVPLGGDQFLLHGGLGAQQQSFADLHLLSRVADSSSWEWMTLPQSPRSANPPARAWHSATMTESGVVVVAYGMDTVEGEPSDEVWFLEVNEVDGSYVWSKEYRPAVVAAEDEEAEGDRIVWQVTEGGSGLRKRQIKNPKWTTSTNARGQTVTVWEAPETSTEVYWQTTTEPRAQDTTPAAYTAPVATWTPYSSVARPTFPSTHSSSSLPTSATASSTASDSSDDESTSKQTTIAATVGSLVALVAVLGLGGMAIRRHQARKGALAAAEGHQETPTPGFVTQLMYTRPVNKRMLSLGSTVSSRRSPTSDAASEALDEMTEVPLDVAGRGQLLDPFSDAHTVDELGQLQARSAPPSPLPFPSSPPLESSASPAKGLIAALSPSIASVASIPYLAALTRISSNESFSSYSQSQSHNGIDGGDNYTVMTPTLGSRRSLRRLREDNTPLPPSEEFPAASQPAPSAFDGRRGSWLAFARRGSKSSSQGHSTTEGMDEMRQVPPRSGSPASSMAATVGAGASRMNSRASRQSGRSGGEISRPHTPLRVVNVDVLEEEAEGEDPFRDQ